MKIVVLSLAILTTAVCEVPPPFYGSFRPSQPLIFSPRNQIQTVYGPPRQRLPSAPQTQYGVPNTKNVEFLEDLLGPIIPPRTVSKDFGFIRSRIIDNRPQTTYGVPSKQQLPQRIHGNPYQQQVVHSQPQTSYGIPSRQQVLQTSYGIPDEQPIMNSQPQTTYGVPSKQQVPQIIYGIPDEQQVVNRQPQTTYGIPSQQQVPQTSYGIPDEQRIINSQPQTTYGVPNKQQVVNNSPQTTFGLPSQHQLQHFTSGVKEPQTQYGVPDQRGIESFERFQQQRYQIQQQPSTEQYLPIREAVNFRKSPNVNTQFVNGAPSMELSQQYLPIKEATNFRNSQPKDGNFGGVQNDIDLPNQNQDIGSPLSSTEAPNHDFPPLQNSLNQIDIHQVEVKSVGQEGVNPQSYQSVNDRYLPPTTTTTERGTTERYIPAPTTTTVRPTEGTVRTTEATFSESEDVTPSNPNVAIATAVAGGEGRTFFLVQPDGRFQKVVYKKTQEPGDQENEYTADYNFQNIQADPNVIYTPLINLG